MDNSKILILGKGYIGSRIQEELGGNSSEKIFYKYSDVENEVMRYNPKVIINCIGITGRNNVDDCELVKDDALLANSFLPVMLAEIALRNNIKLIHISSGCIFNYDYAKDKPISEESTPDFFDLFYSRTKIYSEAALKILASKYPVIIARIRIPLDNRPSPKNILDKLIKYKKVIDIENSITYIPDFIKMIKHLIDIEAKGIFNTVNKGALKYPELLDVYKKYVPSFNYEIIDYNKLNLIRTNLILSTEKLEKSGFSVRNIHEVLEECVKNYTKSW